MKCLTRNLSKLTAVLIAVIGPVPITSGFTPVHAEDTIRQSGDKPLFLASSSVIITTAAAPSLMEEEFPAVTDPVPSYSKQKAFMTPVLLLEEKI